MRRGFRSFGCLVALAFAVLAIVGASSAFGATAAPGYAVSDWATGMANTGSFGVGPVGVAADPNSIHDIYVMNYASSRLYKYNDAAGGVEDATHFVGVVADTGIFAYGTASGPAGIAFDKTGRLYVAIQGWWRVAEIDKTSGQILRYLGSPYASFGDGTGQYPGATGIATDPLSGDLFVSTLSLGGISVIRVPTSGIGGSLWSGPFIDGITFGPDGTLWGAGGGPVTGSTARTSRRPAALPMSPSSRRATASRWQRRAVAPGRRSSSSPVTTASSRRST